jgi:two-component system sensor histidine kinase/response regulator
MADRMHQANPASDLLGLSELYQAAGAALNVADTCERFCHRLMLRKNLSYAAVWVKAELLARRTGQGYTLVHSHPRSAQAPTSLPADSGFWERFGEEPLFLGSAGELSDSFGLVTGNPAGEAVAWFKMEEVGFLELGARNASPALNALEMKKLSGVVQSFAAAVRGGLAQEKVHQAEATTTKTTQALARTRNNYRWLVENVAEVVWIMDSNLSITFSNGIVEEFLGYSPEQIRQMNFLDLMAPESRAVAEATMTRLKDLARRGRLRNFQTFDIELCFLSASGDAVWGESSLRVVKDSSQGGFEIMGATRNITARRETREMLVKAKLAAEEGARAKSMFLANMSHEIRTPLNGIIGMTRTLERTPLSAHQAGIAKVISSSAMTLLGLLNNILDFSRGDAGMTELKFKDFSLVSVLEEVAGVVSSLAIDKGLSVLVDVPPDLPDHFQGDGMRLGQIMLNLAGNAVKFTETGEIRISARLVENRDKGHLMALSVADTGVGIPEDKLEGIFQYFVQGEPTSGPQQGGAGLGLAISRQLAQLMGGEIAVESEQGTGSVFTLTLPLAKGHERRRSPRWGAGILAGHELSVIAPSDAGFQLLARQLQFWGLAVHRVEPTSEQGVNQAFQEDSVGLLCAAPHGSCADCAAGPHEGALISSLIEHREATGAMQIKVERPLGDQGKVIRLMMPPKRSELARTLESMFLSPAGKAGSSGLQADSPDFMRGRKILIVEDNRVNLEVLRNLVLDWGCIADEACTGREAVAAVKDRNYDLVLMDLQMPEMDGREATAAIRAMEVGGERRTPIMACTAHVFADDIDSCLDAGMDGFISKPIDPAGLLQECRRVLQGAEPEAPEAPRVEEVEEVEVPDSPIDLERLTSSTLGNQEFAERLVKNFLADSGRTLVEMERTLEQGDMQACGKAAHSLKGASLTLGVRKVSGTAQVIEHSCRHGREDRTRKALPLLRKELDQAAILLADVLSSGSIGAVEAKTDRSKPKKASENQ